MINQLSNQPNYSFYHFYDIMFFFPHLINALDGSMSRNISSSVKRFKMGSYNADVRNNLAEKSSSVNDWNEIRGHKF